MTSCDPELTYSVINHLQCPLWEKINILDYSCTSIETLEENFNFTFTRNSETLCVKNSTACRFEDNNL